MPWDSIPTDLSPTTVTCAQWISGSDVMTCCGDLLSDTSPESTALFEIAADMATNILYLLSGRQYGGVCSAAVRPCADPCRCGWGQVLSSGHVVGFEDYTGRWWNECGRGCGCSPLSRVKLPGYPVQEITGVLIDGVAVVNTVDDTNWRLDEHRWLTRMADPDGRTRRWPGCQRLDVAPSRLGSFQVSYTYGQKPPIDGVMAARELACQIALAIACHEDCQLPQGVTRVVRQGVTIERAQLDLFGKGRTGLVLVDAFLGSVNPGNLRRRTAVWSPDVQGYARPL